MKRLDHKPFITLRSPLEVIPRQWLEAIEPHIKRVPNRACWLWTGRTESRTFEPIIELRTLGGKRSNRSVKLIVANIFWPDFDERVHHVLHECGTKNCLAPHHFLVTNSHPGRINLDKLVTRKRTFIRDYEKSLLRKKSNRDEVETVEGEFSDVQNPAG